MLGSVYAHIFGEANARRAVYELSRRVYEQEDPEFDVDEWVAGAHPLDDHALEHPLVTELAAEHETGAGAALAYLEDMEETDVAAVIRWMKAGAFKGLFETDAAFAADHFGSSLDDYVAAGLDIGEVEFPPGLTLSEFINWEDVAHEAIEVEETFYTVAVDAGVYVFDVPLDIDRYRE